jgi:hypothetical protein
MVRARAEELEAKPTASIEQIRPGKQPPAPRDVEASMAVLSRAFAEVAQIDVAPTFWSV